MPKAKAKKLVVDESLINSCLPDAPKGYSHRIVQESATIYRVDLLHEKQYMYKQGEPVITIWGFVKKDQVHRVGIKQKPSREAVCHLLDASDLSGYSSIIPTGPRSLLHLK